MPIAHQEVSQTQVIRGPRPALPAPCRADVLQSPNAERWAGRPAGSLALPPSAADWWL